MHQLNDHYQMNCRSSNYRTTASIIVVQPSLQCKSERIYNAKDAKVPDLVLQRDLFTSLVHFSAAGAPSNSFFSCSLYIRKVYANSLTFKDNLRMMQSSMLIKTETFVYLNSHWTIDASSIFCIIDACSVSFSSCFALMMN